MKIDRMLEIVIYLLNHKKVSARQLAERFQTSMRTIQRDMESISIAGIPIGSREGKNGGYFILEDYKLKNQFLSATDFGWILAALNSLNSGYDSDRLNSIIEKYTAILEPTAPQVVMDYSIAKEGLSVRQNNYLLERAIASGNCVAFDYHKPDGEVTRRNVQPLLLRFKWYAWYLTAYDTHKKDYRIFKVALCSA